MTGFQKNAVTLMVIIVFAFAAFKYFAPDTLNPFATIGKLNTQVTNLRSTLDFTQKANADLKEQYANIVSESTTDARRLEQRLSEITAGNDSLKVLVKQLKGELTGVHSGTGDIVVGDTLEVVVTDSVITASDDFIDIKYTPLKQSLSWHLSAYIRINGVEKTDWYGNRRYVATVFLESKTSGRKIDIPWTANYLTYKPKIKLLRYNPTLHGQTVFGVDGLLYGVSFNLFTFGVTKYTQDTYFYLLTVGVASNFKNNVCGTFAPVSYNLGTALPLITNFNVAPILTLDKNGAGFKISIDLSL